MRSTLLPLALAFALVGCPSISESPAEAPAPSSPAESAVQAAEPAPAKPVEYAPTPYTAEQIQDASPVGREWHFRNNSADGTTVWTVMRIIASDDEGATIERTTRGGEGAVVGEPMEGAATWEELRDHARFIKSWTTIADETIETAAGRFDCKRYTVTEDTGGSTRYWFARELPGAPVKMETLEGGEVVGTRMLMRHVAG